MKKQIHLTIGVVRIFAKILAYAATIAAAILILDTEIVQILILRLAPIKFVAEFVAGLLYTSFITIPVSIALLTSLSEISNPYFIALIGGSGAVFGDFLILNVFNEVNDEIQITKQLKIIEKVPKFFLRILGFLCLMLPVPDEIAMAFLGISKIRIKTFILIVFPAKTFGIFMITMGASSVLT